MASSAPHFPTLPVAPLGERALVLHAFSQRPEARPLRDAGDALERLLWLSQRMMTERQQLDRTLNSEWVGQMCDIYHGASARCRLLAEVLRDTNAVRRRQVLREYEDWWEVRADWVYPPGGETWGTRFPLFDEMGWLCAAAHTVIHLPAPWPEPLPGAFGDDSLDNHTRDGDENG